MLVMIHATVYAFAFLLASTIALPITPNKRDVVDPPITSPDATTLWHVGDKQTVTWDTSTLPPAANITNTKGKVVLGFLTSDSENLMINTPLAQGFSIFDGSVDITVPNVPERTNYIIALMGDSGNISPEFTILGGSSPPVSASSIVSSASTSATPSSPHVSFSVSVTPLSSTPLSTPAPAPSTAQVVSSISSAAVSTSPPNAEAASIAPSSSSDSVASSSTTVGGSRTNGAWSSKQIQLSSVVVTVLVALIMV